MNIAVVHYHLRRGGVTRIIQHAVRAPSADSDRAVVLTGEPPADPEAFPCPVRVVDGLGYDEAQPRARPDDLAAQLLREAAAALGATPDLWHVHNHALGKNAALPAAVLRLARLGHRLLLQVHDFPEDGRPSNYGHLRDYAAAAGAPPMEEALYPAAPHIHYAALNRRDAAILRQAGVAPGQCHLLPNPATLEHASSATAGDDASSRRLILYPTRAIRRKNLGEFLLWSALGSPGDRFGVTLAPENPAARPMYDRWVQFAGERALPVAFEVGNRSALPFPALLRTARVLITTSVAEGFGMAFLEPWLAQRALVGRDLSEITGEFQEAGVNLSGLYPRLEVPLAWIGRESYRRALDQALRASRGAYGRSTTDHDTETAYRAAVRGDVVDFGRLDEAQQEAVLDRVLRSPEDRKSLKPNRLAIDQAGDAMADNQAAIEQTYGIALYGRRLEAIYRSLAESIPADVSAHACERILDAFLAPDRFFLLRT